MRARKTLYVNIGSQTDSRLMALRADLKVLLCMMDHNPTSAKDATIKFSFIPEAKRFSGDSTKQAASIMRRAEQSLTDGSPDDTVLDLHIVFIDAWRDTTYEILSRIDSSARLRETHKLIMSRTVADTWDDICGAANLCCVTGHTIIKLNKLRSLATKTTGYGEPYQYLA